MACNCYKKSTAKAVNVTSQAVAANGIVNYTQFNESGISIVESGNTGLKILKPGLYLVTFNASVASGATAGLVTAQLMRNGIAEVGAVSSAYSASATVTESVAFTTVIEVLGSCNCVNNETTLTVANTGVDGTFANAQLTVVKLA